MPAPPAWAVFSAFSPHLQGQEGMRNPIPPSVAAVAVQGSQTHREVRPWKPNNTSGPKMHAAQPQIVRLEALYTPRPPESNEVRSFAV